MRHLALVLALSACSFDVPSEPPLEITPYCSMPEPMRHAELARALELLPTRDQPLEGYNREAWGRWHDFDSPGDCQDTRAETLIAASETRDIRFSNPDRPCTVVTGRWTCPYTLKTFTYASDLDIDHVVSLRTMFELVGRNPIHKWEALDIEMGFIEHGNLLAVDDSTNRSKGGRKPSAWLPEPPLVRCDFLKRYSQLFVGYAVCYGHPAFTDEEQETMARQNRLCSAGGIPAAPQIDGDVDVEPPVCCKTCRTSQACGDSCIASWKVCTRAPGCACQEL